MRCISTGLDPFKDPKQSLVSSVELKQIKEKNEALRKIVIPEIELLYSQIAGTNFMVAYSDENGLVLDTIYDKTCLQGDVGKSVIPGSIWAEKVCGTNGLGLSVELKKPTIVSGKEHFFIAHEKISCFASPIINYDGKTIGIIDASTDSKSREQHTLALVKLATRSIETKLFIKKFSTELILSFHPRSEYLSTTSVGLLANAKIMLHGLVDLKNENFNNIFTNSFSSIVSDLLNNKILKITDHLGSSVFVVKSQNFQENKIKENTSKKTYACKSCKDTKIKREKCVLIRSTFLETNNISVASRKLGVSRTTIYKHLN
jgi:transcriptional regulator of acetoin/glycerol metabolism